MPCRAIQIEAYTLESKSAGHERVLLIVDGHRSDGELIHLTDCRKDDVVKLLRDLEKLPVIHILNWLAVLSWLLFLLSGFDVLFGSESRLHLVR